MPKVLVIDDDVQVRQMLTHVLEEAGYGVKVASDGGEGVRIYRKSPVDVVILDVIMPDKEGVETLQELKSFDPGLKTIAISGGGRNRPGDYLNVMRALGAQEIFEKPVSKEKLLEAVRSLYRRSLWETHGTS
ncbi:MAG: response regulator [Spirochaetia bacterium]